MGTRYPLIVAGAIVAIIGIAIGSGLLDIIGLVLLLVGLIVAVTG